MGNLSDFMRSTCSEDLIAHYRFPVEIVSLSSRVFSSIDRAIVLIITMITLSQSSSKMGKCSAVMHLLIDFLNFDVSPHLSHILR